MVHALSETASFIALQVQLPALRAQVTGARSVTIGINLSGELLQESATILSLETERVEGRPGLLERILVREGGRTGLTPLRQGEGGTDNALLRDLRRLLERVVAPVVEALESYTMIRTRALDGLGPELAFLLNSVALIARVQQTGLPLCRPQIAPLARRSRTATTSVWPCACLISRIQQVT